MSHLVAELGGSTMTLQAENTTEHLRAGELDKNTFDDIDVLRRRGAGVNQAAPIMAAGVGREGCTVTPRVPATADGRRRVRASYPGGGRIIAAGEGESRRRAALIDTQPCGGRETPDNPGEYFQIGTEWLSPRSKRYPSASNARFVFRAASSQAKKAISVPRPLAHSSSSSTRAA